MTRAGFAAVASALVLGLAAPAFAGDVMVGSGSTFDLGTGSLMLGCADLAVTGTLTAGSVGFSAARDVAINPGGVVNGNSAVLSLSGDWDNAGTFNAGTSTVQMVDGCALLSSVVVGDTSFANLSISTTSAKQVSFTAGSTQTVTGLLTLLGSAGSLLQIRSTLNGVAAFFDVSGTSSASFVDVQDNDAQPGNDIVLDANSVKGSNTPGWTFGIPVPLLGPVALTLLALLLLVSGQRWLSRPTRAGHAF
jgi:hypothetical protein